MLFTFSGYGACDDGITVKVNGVQIGQINQFGGASFSFNANINFDDIIDIYNLDIDLGYCWSPGVEKMDFTYDSQTWHIDYSSDWGWCGGVICKDVGWDPSQYPGLVMSFRLTSSGPVRIDSRRFDCYDSSSSSSLSSSSLSSSLSSISSLSSSSSSGEYPFYGTTYYSELKDVHSINNAVINNAEMQFGGYWEQNWSASTLDFNKMGYGLKRTINNQGSIYCNDTSKLFSMDKGYVGIIISLPFSITNGVYLPLVNDTAEFNEYLLWGVNVGRYETSQPSLYASLTPRGIEFTVWTSAGKHTISDTSTNIEANADILLEFAWDSNELDNYLARTVIRVNEVDVAIGNQPINNDSLVGLNFYVLNTPFSYNNFECTIRKLVTYNKIPDNFIVELWSSSSSSSTSSSTSSSI